MSTYFAFSDEAGDYKQEKDRSKKFLRAFPYYVRSTFLMLSSEWKMLNMKFRESNRGFNLPLEKEIKWSYIWSLWKYQRIDQVVPKNKPFCFLRDVSYSQLIDFVDSSLALLSDLSSIKIIITVTSNSDCSKIKESEIYKMHIQEIMQRIEMELQNQEENLCVLFIDPISREKNKLFREIYFDLYQKGDFIRHYSHIKDSLNLEYSHHSVGIQLADYIAGSFEGFLRGYKDSKRIFNKRVRPFLRKGMEDEILGFGIREVPRNDKLRICIMKKLNT